MVECKLSLELTKNGVQKSVQAKMGEKKSRKLLITLTEKGKVYDLEGYEARVSYDDKTYTKATIDGNVVEFILPSTLLSGPGERLCELEISVPGESVLYSPMFIVNVEGSLGAEAKNEAVGKGVEYQQVIPDLEETADMGEETYIAVYEKGKGTKKYKVKGLGGASKHSELSGRDEADQHPIESISGLRDTLDEIDGMTYHNNSLILNLENETDRLDKAHRALRSEFDPVHYTVDVLDSAVKTSIIPALDDLKSVKHFHVNKPVLDRLGVSAENVLTFDEKEVGSGGGSGSGEIPTELIEQIENNTEARHTHTNKEILDKFGADERTPTFYNKALAFRGGIPAELTADHISGIVDGINPTENVETHYISGRRLAEFSRRIADLYAQKKDLPESGNVDLSDYYTKLESDELFAKKSDIPIDESYELIGQTPLTLAEKSNIKLVVKDETTYEAKTPTVWNFDDFFASGNYTLTKCTLERENDHYKVVADNTTTAHYQSYVRFLIPVEIGKTYKLCFNSSASKKDTTNEPNDWGGQLALYDGEGTGTLFTATFNPDLNPTYEFVSTTGILHVRFYPARAAAKDKANSIARFNAMWLNEGTATELTDIYSVNGTTDSSIVLQKVPKGATITATPTASVYKKAPTDKTLTKADTPADAEATGKAIEETKALLPLYGKTIVNFGDSIFGNAQPPVDISTHLAKKTGATVYNCGFGGCRMTPHPTSWYDAFSMYRIADAITSRNFTVQDEAIASGNLAERYSAGLERLKSIDFSKVDIITIAYGTNDFNGYGAELDNEENNLDINSFGSALRYSIETILATYPNVRIFVLSTTWNFSIDSENNYTEDSNTRTNAGGQTIQQYNEKLKEVAEEYNLPFVDDYNIGIGKHNRSYYFNANDGTHHKETGRKLIASHLAKELY